MLFFSPCHCHCTALHGKGVDSAVAVDWRVRGRRDGGLDRWMKLGAVGGGVRVKRRARRAHHVLITCASVGMKFPFVRLFA